MHSVEHGGEAEHPSGHDHDAADGHDKEEEHEAQGKHGDKDHSAHGTSVSFDANRAAVAGPGFAAIEGAVAFLAEGQAEARTSPAGESHDEHAEHGHDEHAHGHTAPPFFSGEWYVLGDFGKLRMAIGYYIDALTVCMFCMVTLIASCIHFYATGYMHDELHDFTDPEVTMSDGSKLTRPGRYHRFFQALSLFCFSMLGLVIAGNVAMTFVFWELVGICSYFLIGFYVERKSASNAANKAFITNRVGDFGMIIGLMALWGSIGTFNYGPVGDDPGLFESVRSRQRPIMS